MATRLPEAQLGNVHASANPREGRTHHAERSSPVALECTNAAAWVHPSREGVDRFR